MEIARDILVFALLGLGSFFYLVGAIGLVRMPEIFTRIHASSVSDTLGAGALILAMMIAAGWSLNTAKLAIILAILLYTGPVATHALAQAALTAGLVPRLAEDRTGRRSRARPASRKASPAVSRRRAAPKRGTGGRSEGGKSSKR